MRLAVDVDAYIFSKSAMLGRELFVAALRAIGRGCGELDGQ